MDESKATSQENTKTKISLSDFAGSREEKIQTFFAVKIGRFG
jgi:hypothetical protein